ncbi:Zn(II)2Cys6 transcription factor domain-containing protein [Sporobolomyces koalae]|uniref:Zn(II)2Cys6 transcription factor domain-containing protein n=1 Tax=Sporobolomyces koalae TaxID=500713 RepID=UPI00316C5A91
MASNGYPYGTHQPGAHHSHSPLLSASTSGTAGYSIPSMQSGVSLLSNGPLGGSLPPSGAPPSSSYPLPSGQSTQPPLSYYNDPYPASYPPPPIQHHQPQQQFTQQYVPRPVSAASNNHSPATASSSVLGAPHAQPPLASPHTVTGLPAAAESHLGPELTPPPATATAKARSSVACALCRKQKMKCEGPDKKPCRRCRAAGVDCVFEAPPVAPPRPRGGGVTEAWVESRLSAMDQRVSLLEENGSSLVHSPADSNRGSGTTTADHERRIAALEAQIYALQLQTAQAPPPRQAQLDYSQSPLNPLSASVPLPSPQQHTYGISGYRTDSPGNASFPLPGSNSGQAHARYASNSSLKHESDSQSGGYTHDGMSDYSSAKRWKGDERTPRSGNPYQDEPDFISRGVVTEEEAAMCYDSYFLTFAANSPLSDQHHLSFVEVRRRSPMYLATIVSIGARSLSRVDTFHTCLREALQLAHEMFTPLNDGTKQFAILSVKAITLLGLYYSLPHLLLASVMLSHRAGTRSALDEFEELSDEQKNSKIGRILAEKGRMMFISSIWGALYTQQAGEPSGFELPMKVLLRQIDVLSNSSYASPVTDAVFRTNLELCAILLESFNKLGPGMVNQTRDSEKIRAQVDQSILELRQWSMRRADMMVVVSQWGDSREIKAILPFHHGQQCLMRYIFRPEIPLQQYDRTDAKLREYAKMAMESALVILRWGVESRIWMPFSIVGGYVHQVNIPTALHHLFTAARLFPDEADFRTIRPLLHRLLKQSDLTIQGPASTKREVHRAEMTKAEVLEFDRFAYEASGEEFGADATEDQPGLVGHEIGQSIASFRLELNLWSSPLRAVEDDTY